MLGALLLCAGCGDNLTPYQVLYVGNVWGGNLAVDDGRVYFTTFYHGPEEDQAVWSVPADGGEPTLLWHGAPGMIFGFGMAVDDGDLFWSQQDTPTNAVFSVSIEGGDRAEVGRFTTTQAPYAGVDVEDDWIFAGSHDQIVRIPRDGGGAVPVFEGPVGWIDREGGPLYFISGETLQRLDPVTGAAELVANISAPGDFALAGDVAYIAGGDAVWTVPLDGGDPTQLVAGLERPGVVAIGKDAVFVTAEDDGGVTVLQIPLVGGEPRTLFRTRIIAPSMVVDGDQLYLAFCCEDDGSTSGGQVVRIDL